MGRLVARDRVTSGSADVNLLKSIRGQVAETQHMNICGSETSLGNDTDAPQNPHGRIKKCSNYD